MLDGRQTPELVDGTTFVAENSNMNTDTTPILDADTQALMDRIVHGTPLPPDVYQRIQERGDQLTEEIRQKYGTIEIAVDLIREIRDEE